MNNCNACQKIAEGADPMMFIKLHTCASAPVFDFLEKTFAPKFDSIEEIVKPFDFVEKMDEVFDEKIAGVDFALKPDLDNVITLPVDDKEFEKDQLLFGLTSAIHNLQRFVTVNSLRIFTPWDLEVIEEEKSKLEILFELLREKK